MGQRALGSFATASRIAETTRAFGPNRPRGDRGRGFGDVLAPSPVESDKMLAATCGTAWWAGLTPRGIPIWRVVGSLARIEVRADSCCFHGSRVLGFAFGQLRGSAGRAEGETRRPVRGFASSHPPAPICPRVRSSYSPVRGTFRASLRASSVMGRPVDARATIRPGGARACPLRRAASAARQIGTRGATAVPCLCRVCPLGSLPGSPVTPSLGKPSTLQLPRTLQPPRSTRAR